MPGCAETQYIFDSSFDLGYITSDVYSWLYGLDFNLDRLVDYANKDITLSQLQLEISEAGIREVFYKDSDCEFDVQRLVGQYFGRAYSQMSLVEKSFYDLEILFNSGDQPWQMKHQLAKRLTDCLYGNSYQTPLMRLNDCSDLSDPKNVEYVLTHDGNIKAWIVHMRDRISTSVSNLQQVDKHQLRDLIQMRADEREARIRQHYQMLDLDYRTTDRGIVLSKGLRYGELTATEKKTARKSITRAMNLFGKFFNKSDIEGFIKGHEYIVEGEKFDYRLTKGDRTNILQHTLNPKSVHIPYDLEITTKSGIVLAKACYLFENTPIIDQIIAFTMMIKSGSEDEFLQKANMFQRTAHYQDSDLAKFKNNIVPVGGDLDPRFDNIVSMMNDVSEYIEPIFNQAQEREIWINRISESCDSLFAKHLNISQNEWHQICNARENTGFLLDNPDAVLTLEINCDRMLTLT